MRGQGNKTDRADARLIAEYAQRERPPAWRPPPPKARELQGLVRRRDDLGELAATQRSIRRTVAFLEKEADRLQDQADALIAASEALAADRDLLRSIPGVGAITAAAILAELPEPARFASAQQVAAYAGLAPREYPTLCKLGRKSLFFQDPYGVDEQLGPDPGSHALPAAHPRRQRR